MCVYVRVYRLKMKLLLLLVLGMVLFAAVGARRFYDVIFCVARLAFFFALRSFCPFFFFNLEHAF